MRQKLTSIYQILNFFLVCYFSLPILYAVFIVWEFFIKEVFMRCRRKSPCLLSYRGLSDVTCLYSLRVRIRGGRIIQVLACNMLPHCVEFPRVVFRNHLRCSLLIEYSVIFFFRALFEPRTARSPKGIYVMGNFGLFIY